MPIQPDIISCPLCKKSENKFYALAKDIEYFTSNQTFRYYRCESCSIIFLYPLPLNELDIIYPENYYSNQPGKKGIAFKIKAYLDKIFFRKTLKQIDSTRISVLDVGGGTGWLLNTIRRIDKRVTHTQIVDISKTAQGPAQQSGHGYFCGSLEQFTSSEKFDVILMLNLIEHVENPASTIKKGKELLKENGVIILKTPNYRSLDARLFKTHSWGGYHCPRHWTIFDRNSMTTLANDAGLSVMKSYYTQGAPFWTVNILHGLQNWQIIDAGKDKPLVYHPLFGPVSIMFALFDFLRKPFAPLSQMFFILTNKLQE